MLAKKHFEINPSHPVMKELLERLKESGGNPDKDTINMMDALTAAFSAANPDVTFEIENRPGGNGFIALSAAKGATPDGYTLAFASSENMPQLMQRVVNFANGQKLLGEDGNGLSRLGISFGERHHSLLDALALQKIIFHPI